MQRSTIPWFSLVALTSLSLGCPSSGGDDELGGETGGSEDSTTGGDENSDSGSSDESTSTTDTTTDESTGSTDSTDSDSTDSDSTDSDSTDATDSDSDSTETGGDGFALIEAALSPEKTTLVLTFSENLAPVDMVDPADFRISYAWTYSVMYMYLYEVSYYIDPNDYVGNSMVDLVGISNGPGPDQLSLELAPALDSNICTAIDEFIAGAPPNGMVDAALFPHYSPGAEPVMSEGGAELAPIGPDWVLTDQNYLLVEEFHWPNLDPQVPIPCNP
jgi:hypothetical protein